MAYTVSFPTSGSQLPIDDVAQWLTENGEPFTREGPESLVLRAVPVTLLVRETGTRRAHVDVTAAVKLARMVEVLYEFALLSGSDVCLAEEGKMTRGQLWLRFSDEQDRMRIAEALKRADAMGRLTTISQAMWGVLAATLPGRDVRWDTGRECVVELLEVGADSDNPGGISTEDAAWHTEEPKAGDVIARPIEPGYSHTVLWRWLSETHPSIATL